MVALRKYAPVVLVLVTVLAIGAASGVLASGDSGDVINACVANRNGEIRIVPEGFECRRGWTPLQWNQQGPAGVSGYEVVVGFWADTAVPPGELASRQTWCPPEKNVIGGGYAYANFDAGALIVEDSFPVTEEGDHKWRVQWRNMSDAEVTDDLQIWAICVYASP